MFCSYPTRRHNGLTVSPTIFMYVSTALVANVLPRNMRFSFSAGIQFIHIKIDMYFIVIMYMSKISYTAYGQLESNYFVRTCVFHLRHDNVTEELLCFAHHLEDPDQCLGYLVLGGRERERERGRVREKERERT